MKIGQVVVCIVSVVVFSWGNSWNYKVSSGLLGKLGSINVSKTQDEYRYRIDAKVITGGIAAVLTGNRKEYYRSEGVVQNGQFRARTFQIRRVMKKKNQIDTYRINPVKKRIVKRKQRWKKGKKTKDYTKTLPYFSENDLATLYINMIPVILKAPPGSRWSFKAVGAEKVKGRVLVTKPEVEEAQRLRKKLGVGKKYTILVISSWEKILSKRNRKLTLAIDPEGVLYRAHLVALPVVGEIWIKRSR